MLIKTLDFHFRKQAEGIQLEVYSRDSSQPLATANVKLPPSLLGSFELKQLDFDPKDPSGRVQRLREYGHKLYQQVFPPEVAAVWSAHKQSSEFLVLCVRIAPDANELETIPWETLFDGEEFIATGTKSTISRLPLDVQPQSTLPAVPLPVKMFALVSSPLDLPDNSRLQIEREQEILLEAINDPAGQGRLRADFEDEAKLEIVEGSLETPYQIFHYTGHGMAPENGGGLLLEDVQGKSRPTSVSEVLQSLQRSEASLRLVVLSGCQTARTINVGGFRDMARGLLRRRIPTVIAMQFSISDAGGLKFAQVFYSKIADGRTLDLASHAARRAMLLSDDDYLKADALAPVLLTSNADCLQTTRAESPSTAEVPRIDFSFYLPLAQLSYGFYGRRREYRQVRDGILQRNQRAVIVYGIGGIGKTALISHVATRLKKRFKGVYAFDCTSGALTPESVMIKLNQYFASQEVKVLEQLLFQNLSADVLANYLAQVLSQWSLLLIFDNFESQLERTDAGFRIADENLRTFVTTLVKTTATGSHFLFTSRYLFELDDKRLGNIQSVPLEDLSRPEALSLMQKLQHLAAASHAEKLEALKTFGGHPYALVTLDRYCNHQPLNRALEEAKSIHAELREFLAIELNYAQISERGRELLDRLAAFRRSVPYEAAEWVMGERVSYASEFLQANRAEILDKGEPVDEAEFLKMLEEKLPEKRQAPNLADPIRELIEWGLLTPIQEAEQIAELAIHALVREFCRHNTTSLRWNELLHDAADFYTNSSKLIDPEYKTQTAIWADMEAFELLMMAEDYSGAASILIGAASVLDRWGFRQYSKNQHERLLDKLDEAETAIILHGLGNLALTTGEFDRALQYYHRSLEISEKYKHDSHTSITHYQIGTIYLERGEYDKALEYSTTALKAGEQLGDSELLGASLFQIGRIYERQKEYEKALGCYKRAMQIGEMVTDRSAIAASLHQIGRIHFARGESDKAMEHYQESLKIKKELGDRSGIASALGQIGLIYHSQGQFEKALEIYQQVLEVSEDVGDKVSSGISFTQIGRLFLDQARYEEAFPPLLSSLFVFAEVQTPHIGGTIQSLKELRLRWGSEDFDSNWKKSTGEDVPDIFTS